MKNLVAFDVIAEPSENDLYSKLRAISVSACSENLCDGKMQDFRQN